MYERVKRKLKWNWIQKRHSISCWNDFFSWRKFQDDRWLWDDYVIIVVDKLDLYCASVSSCLQNPFASPSLLKSYLLKYSNQPAFICLFSAIHNWHGRVLHGIPLDVGDFVEINEEFGLWYRGTCTRKRVTGIFPKSFIRLKDLTKADPVVTECTQVLREWSELWKKCFVVRILLRIFEKKVFSKKSFNKIEQRLIKWLI